MLAQGVASVKVELLEPQIPFRPEDEKLPTIDFEVAESDYNMKPHWQKAKETNKRKDYKDSKERKNTTTHKKEKEH